MWLVYQDSFIAFLVLDPVGLRPYKQFFREQKGGSDSIWQDGLGQDGTILAKQTHGLSGATHGRGQKNFMIRESLTKPWWIKILEASLKIQILLNTLSLTTDIWWQFAGDRVFRICRADISWICSVGSYGFVCDQTWWGYWHWAGVRWREAMVWKILEINSLCGNQRRFLPFGKSGSWTINRGLLPANEAAASASWQNSKYFHPFPSTKKVTSNHSFALFNLRETWPCHPYSLV